MAKIKSEVIKKVLKYPCYCCHKSIRGKTLPQKKCPICNGTGIFLDEVYYHIVNGICVDSDNQS